jgi:hypothetical protein
MTNLEMMKMVLGEEIDDDGATYEAEIFYHIACPYFDGDKRAWCSKGKAKNSMEMRKQCFGCKNEWLNSEVDE